MPVLAAFLGGLFTQLVAWLGQVLAKRWAIRVALIAFVLTVTATFIAAIEALITGLSVVMPVEVGVAASWVVPDNAVTVVGIRISAEFLRWVYDWNVKVLQYKLL
jgi:hypothetical protein